MALSIFRTGRSLHTAKPAFVHLVSAANQKRRLPCVHFHRHSLALSQPAASPATSPRPLLSHSLTRRVHAPPSLTPAGAWLSSRSCACLTSARRPPWLAAPSTTSSASMRPSTGCWTSWEAPGSAAQQHTREPQQHPPASNALDCSTSARSASHADQRSAPVHRHSACARRRSMHSLRHSRFMPRCASSYRPSHSCSAYRAQSCATNRLTDVIASHRLARPPLRRIRRSYRSRSCQVAVSLSLLVTRGDTHPIFRSFPS